MASKRDSRLSDAARKNTPTITRRGGSTKIPGPCIRSAHPKNEGASLAGGRNRPHATALDQRRPFDPYQQGGVTRDSAKVPKARRRQLPTGPFFLAARRRQLSVSDAEFGISASGAWGSGAEYGHGSERHKDRGENSVIHRPSKHCAEERQGGEQSKVARLGVHFWFPIEGAVPLSVCARRWP